MLLETCISFLKLPLIDAGVDEAMCGLEASVKLCERVTRWKSSCGDARTVSTFPETTRVRMLVALGTAVVAGADPFSIKGGSSTVGRQNG